MTVSALTGIASENSPKPLVQNTLHLLGIYLFGIAFLVTYFILLKFGYNIFG